MKAHPTRNHPSRAERATSALICLGFALLPFAVSPAGFDNFRTPKDIFALGFILLTGVAFLSTGSYRIRLSGYELLVIAGIAYAGIHSHLLGWPPGSSEAWIFIAAFGLLLLLLSELLTWQLQRTVWFFAGLSLAVNALLGIVQAQGLFPWMFRVGGKAVSGRVTPAGFIGEVGSGGLLFGLVVVVSIYFIVSSEQGRRQWAVIGGVTLIGLASTRTITATVSLFFCLVLWGIFHHWWVFRFKTISSRSLKRFWMVVALLVVVGAGVGIRSELGNRVRGVTRSLQAGNLESATAGRYSVFLITWSMIQDQPIRGRGLSSFSREFYDYRANTEYGQSVEVMPQSGAFQQAHNDFLQVWLELGLGGLLLLLLLLGYPLYRTLRRMLQTSDPREAYWCGILCLALLYMVVAATTMFPLRLSVSAAFLILVIGGMRCLDRFGLQERPPSVAASGSRLWLTLLVVLLCAPIGYSQYNKWRANNDLGVAAFLMEGVSQRELQVRQVRGIAGRALAMLDRSRERYDGFPELYNLKGSAAMFLGRHQLAEESYGRAAELMPSPEVLTNLAASHMAQGEDEAAAPLLRSALRYNPTYQPARSALRTIRGRR